MLCDEVRDIQQDVVQGDDAVGVGVRIGKDPFPEGQLPVEEDLLLAQLGGGFVVVERSVVQDLAQRLGRVVANDTVPPRRCQGKVRPQRRREAVQPERLPGRFRDAVGAFRHAAQHQRRVAACEAADQDAHFSGHVSNQVDPLGGQLAGDLDSLPERPLLPQRYSAKRRLPRVRVHQSVLLTFQVHRVRAQLLPVQRDADQDQEAKDTDGLQGSARVKGRVVQHRR
mmetsp:Transcript_3328/g.13309  ORF Transcript_3328/g.13309 Transcript_3328/m.13309 type:complete len:226 (-) Transcript_3328:146-823(-)|eukprot:scaffold1160_cov261-Pinguiococcus_pyrenoidosus.AAC.9